MKLVFATLAVFAMLGFGIAALVEVFAALRNIFTAHPFKTLGNLFLLAIYGALTAITWWIARTILNKENA